MCQCRKAAYCNRLCQMRHWKIHRPTCEWTLKLQAIKGLMQQALPLAVIPEAVVNKVAGFLKDAHSSHSQNR
jgi:hypothetical protein